MSYTMFDVSVRVDSFGGRHRAILLQDTETFLRQLAAFESSRSGSVMLRGRGVPLSGGDFELCISAHGHAGRYRVDFQLSEAHHSSSAQDSVTLSCRGGFISSSGEFLPVVRGFQKLLHEVKNNDA